MQEISNYQKSDAFLRLLLQGSPKSGKTTLACHFPRPYIIDIDRNLGGPIEQLNREGHSLPIGYDVLDRDDTGKEVPLGLRYTRLSNCLIAAANNPAIETIIIDSATTLIDIMQADVLRQQNKSAFDKQMWGFFFQTGKKFCGELAKIRKHVILIAHEVAKEDELDHTTKYRVAWPGQMGDIIGAFFTDIWRTEVAIVPSGNHSTYKWNLRTMPDHRFNLGGSLKLPPLFEFKWETVEAALKQVTGEKNQ